VPGAQLRGARLAARLGLAHSAGMAKSAPRAVAVPDDQAEPLAAVEDMIATLKDLRGRTNDRALLGSYQAAIDRLDALAYRLTEAGSTPAPAPAPKPPRAVAAPSSPQAALPLGPVIVVARKPRRR
jgi:hypothetical protein